MNGTSIVEVMSFLDSLSISELVNTYYSYPRQVRYELTTYFNYMVKKYVKNKYICNKLPK
jgi:hypothetical protein